MRPALLRAYFVGGTAALAVFLALPSGFFKDVVWYTAIGLAGTAAILVGVRRNRPASATAWYLFAAGQLATVGGDITWSVYRYALGADPFPSAADGLYLAAYPALAAGFAVLVRRRGPRRDWTSLLDASIIALGLAVVYWTYLISPQATDSESGVWARVFSSAYPVGDVLLLAVAVRLLVGPGRRNASFLLLATSVLALLAGDTLFQARSLSGVWTDGTPIDLTWLASYLLWGTAALHPSMRSLDTRAPEGAPPLSHLRLAILASAALVPLGLLAVEASNGSPARSAVAIGSSAVLFVLAIARIAGVVASHERALRRESILRRAAAALVGAPDREGIYHAAVASALALVKSLGRPLALLVLARPEGPVVAAGAGERAAGLEGTVLPSLPGAFEALRGRSSADVPADVRTRVGIAEGRAATVFPLVVRGDVKGGIVVITDQPQPSEARTALETLTAQVALALETTALAEERQARRSERRLSALVNNASDAIAVVDPGSVVLYASPSSASVLGYEPGELTGRELTELVPKEDRARTAVMIERVARAPGPHAPVETRLLRADGELRSVEIVASNLLDDPDVGGLVLTIRDVTERRRLEEQLIHQAFHDPLTGLANRALFSDRIDHALARSARNGEVSVLFIDLDDFKTVNDSLGHAAGDRLLAAVARRLESSLRPGDTCARLGGDEFAVLLEGAGAKLGARVGRRILEALSRPLQVAGKDVVVRASAGIAASNSGSSSVELLRNADTAMYRAKIGGKGRLVVFRRSMRRAALERLELKAELLDAVEAGELSLAYQPIVDLRTGEIVSVEALLRWQNPRRGLLLPGEFIELAEETELIVPIGSFVLEEACRRCREWQEDTTLAVSPAVSVNLSSRQLLGPEIVETVRAVLARSGLAPTRLTLEVTESTLMRSVEGAGKLLRALRGLGVRLAIDDFGTGYSSLSYLKELPFDVLKIAKPFVDGAGGESEERLVGAIIEMGKSLGLRTIAEGIETVRQRDRLRDLGCELGQGFLFARPLPEPRLRELLRSPRLGAAA